MASMLAPRAPKDVVESAYKKQLHPGVLRILDDLALNKPLTPGVRDILDSIFEPPSISPVYSKPMSRGRFVCLGVQTVTHYHDGINT
jgi:hypothetical protein